MSIEQYVKAYEEGVITKYELFFQTQSYGLKMTEEYREEYEEWDKARHADKCRTFSITA